MCRTSGQDRDARAGKAWQPKAGISQGRWPSRTVWDFQRWERQPPARWPLSRGAWKRVVKHQQQGATQMAETLGCSGTRLRETMPTVSRVTVDILPDVVQGWLLLEKAGLDLEKSIIQSDIKSHFSLEGVENSLRAHWTDGQVRRRDGAERTYGVGPGLL